MEKEERNLAIVEHKARELRIARSLTQKAFSKKLGISTSYLCDIENGRTGLNLELLNKVCNLTDVSFDYMFGFCNEINKNIIKVNSIDLKALGNNIKTIRLALNYTQKELAEKLNISRSLVTHYEKGTRVISTADLKQICEISGYSADWCVGKLEKCFRREPKQKIKPDDFKKLTQS